MKSKHAFMSSLALVPIVLICIYPFVWMFFSAFKTNSEIYKPQQLLPHAQQVDARHFKQLLAWNKNAADALRTEASRIRRTADGLKRESAAFTTVIDKADALEAKANALTRDDLFDFKTAFRNSLIIALLQAAGAILLCVCAGFVFAKHHFRGKGLLLGLAIFAILIPRQVIALPLSEWLIRLGLYNSLWSIILPGMVTGVGLLFFIKVFKQMPDELLDLARVEGANEISVLWHLTPLIRSSIWAFAFIQFTLAWHEHLMPLLMLESDNQTLPLALSSLMGSSLRYPRAVVMAGGCFTIVPTLLLFVLLYRQIKTALSELTLQ